MFRTFPYFFGLDDRPIDRVRVIGFSYVGCARFFAHLAKNSWGVEKGLKRLKRVPSICSDKIWNKNFPNSRSSSFRV